MSCLTPEELAAIKARVTRLLAAYGANTECAGEAEACERTGQADSLRAKARGQFDEITAQVAALLAEVERLTVAYDKLEEHGSVLTREIEASSAGWTASGYFLHRTCNSAEEYGHPPIYCVCCGASDDAWWPLYTWDAPGSPRLDTEVDQLKARIRELESRPVSAPPAHRGPRSAPAGYPLGWTQHADGVSDPKRVADAYDSLRRWHINFTRAEAEQRLNDWGGRHHLTGADVAVVLSLFPEADAEGAGITEDAKLRKEADR